LVGGERISVCGTDFFSFGEERRGGEEEEKERRGRRCFERFCDRFSFSQPQ
jgi:hypothetical protein